MKTKISLVISLAMTLFLSIIAGAGINQTGSISTQENDAELPIWNIGDSWTYEITMNGGTQDFGIRNIKFTDMTYTVDEVQDSNYVLMVSSDISGYIDLTSSINANFIDTSFTAKALVKKSNLCIEKIYDLDIDGKVKISLVPGQITLDATGLINITYDGDGYPLMFPLNSGDMWDVSRIGIELEIFHGIDIPIIDIQDPINIIFFIQEHSIECIGWDIVDIGNSQYDALRLSSDLSENHNVWFGPSAGNIVKYKGRTMPLSWGSWGYYDIDLELVSTTYDISTNPPEVPSNLQGPPELVAGVIGTYSASTTDPDGDYIRYIFDWGDGEQTGSDFVESGGTGETNHFWSEAGTYEIKVKARDKSGAESSWSDPFTVTVTNNAPTKPLTPDGPASGKKNENYDYTTVSNDPDGHRIKYYFDWGDNTGSWSELTNTEIPVTMSHSWSRRSTYEIKVKAVDEYGAESQWSDPLRVTMPTNNEYPGIINIIIHRLIDIFPILKPVLLPLLN